MEIITGVERRRRWRTDEKLRIVAESEAPGAVISMVARRHGVPRRRGDGERRLVAVRRQGKAFPLRQKLAGQLQCRIIAG